MITYQLQSLDSKTRCEVNGVFIGNIIGLSDCIYYFEPAGQPLGLPVLKELINRIEYLNAGREWIAKATPRPWNDVL